MRAVGKLTVLFLANKQKGVPTHDETESENPLGIDRRDRG